jgi:hypothetical protein
MGLRKILYIEKPVDVKLTETKNKSYHASKIKT